jgi:hypothetical protein
MWVVIPLVVGSVLLVVSGFVWAARRETLDRAAAVENALLVPLGRIEPGRTIALSAKVAGDAGLRDPVSGDTVAFYEARVSRVDGGERVLREVRGGDAIALESDGARAEVRLAGAELSLAWKEIEQADGEPTPAMRELLTAGEREAITREGNARYALFHRAIRRGDRLTVVGTAEPEGDRSVFDSTRGLLIVTDEELDVLKGRERADVRAMSRMLRAAVALGALLVAVGAFVLLRA